MTEPIRYAETICFPRKQWNIPRVPQVELALALACVDYRPIAGKCCDIQRWHALFCHSSAQPGTRGIAEYFSSCHTYADDDTGHLRSFARFRSNTAATSRNGSFGFCRQPGSGHKIYDCFRRCLRSCMLAAVWICHKGIKYETNLAADYIDFIVGLNMDGPDKRPH